MFNWKRKLEAAAQVGMTPEQLAILDKQFADACLAIVTASSEDAKRTRRALQDLMVAVETGIGRERALSQARRVLHD